MTIQEVLQKAYNQLRLLKIETPELEADLLLSTTLNKPRSWLLGHSDYQLSTIQLKKFNNLITKRLNWLPIAYITGEQDFFGFNFKVNKNTLIPRPETELMVEQVINDSQEINKPLIIADIGTGSGCIIISIAKHIKSIKKLYGLDISSKALVIAKKNAVLNKTCVTFSKSDLITFFLKNKKLLAGVENLFLTANLPYVPDDYLDKLQKANNRSLVYEPRSALAGGRDGLDFYQKLYKQIMELKIDRPDLKIKVYMEIQPGQVGGMRKIFGKNIAAKKDLALKDRLIIADL